jgi:hypothetical protein
MGYQHILNTILINEFEIYEQVFFFTNTHCKISSIGTFLHNSFAGRMLPAGRSLETPVLDSRLTNRLTGGGEVSLTRCPLFTPRKIPVTFIRG